MENGWLMEKCGFVLTVEGFVLFVWVYGFVFLVKFFMSV